MRSAPTWRFSASKLARFAHLYGRAETEATEALFEHAADLDDQARERNRQANLAASLFFSGVGLAPGAGPALGTAGSASWAWFFEGYPKDHELNERHDDYERRRFGGEEVRWRRVMWSAWLDAQFTDQSSPATLDVVVEPSDDAATTVPLRRGEAGVEWQHPTTGQWSLVPNPELGEYRNLFPALGDGPSTAMHTLVSDADDLGEDYRDGEIRAADDQEIAVALLASEEVSGDGQAELLYADGWSAAAWTDRWVPRGWRSGWAAGWSGREHCFRRDRLLGLRRPCDRSRGGGCGRVRG